MTAAEPANERLCLAGAGLALGFGALLFWLSRAPGGLVLAGLVAFAGLAAAVGCLSFLQAKLQRLAAAERAAPDPAAGAGPLFDDRAAALLRERNLRQFERYVVPAATLALALAEGGLGVQLLRQLGRPPVVPAAEAAKLTAAVLAVGGVACYLLGSYLAGLAFAGRRGVLRALAGELVGLAWLSGAGLAVTLLWLTDLPDYQAPLLAAGGALLALRALEKVLGAVMELYRPRRPGVEDRLLYESRLNGLVVQPKSLLANVADTLNYQFGIALTPAGIRGAGRALGLLLLGHAAVLLAFSAVVVVRSGERVRLERLGRPHPTRPELGPGLSFKLPWPVDQVYRQRVDAVRQFTLDGAPLADATSAGAAVAQLWQDERATAAELFVTASRGPGAAAGGPEAGGAVSLAAVEAVVQYRVTGLADYLCTSAEPARLLAALARREVTQTLAGLDFFALLQDQQAALATALRDRLQAAADARRLGVTIVLVTCHRLQPPPGDVAAAFASANASDEVRQRLILQAERERGQWLTRESIAAADVRRQTHEYAYRRTRLAAAEVDSNQRLRELYRRHRELYRTRAYLDRLEGLRDLRKVVIATDVPDQLIQLDLKKTRAELFEFTEGAKNE